ncbi:MAG: hypothetical protein KDB03_07985 [Planctomycetales bacterium]|nr:hypothetical protein [Planctomycetales bacterium]
MTISASRRSFLSFSGLCTATLAGSAELGFLSKLPALSAAQVQLPSRLVDLNSGIEPLVRIIESSPRDTLLELVASRIHQGTSYQEVLAALFLAGVRNVQPRPAVGFKFHSVLVVHSAHLASMASSNNDRWLPIFWALDYFKATQLEEEKQSGWKMNAVAEDALPLASKARENFIQSMDEWDPEAADLSIARLARSASQQDLFDLFCRFGARDLRSIGHKAIFVANGFRTLNCIGWQHAEPVLRSLAFALQNHEGDPNPASSELETDQPYRENVDNILSIREDWLDGKLDPSATDFLLGRLSEASPSEVARLSVEFLNKGISPRSIWDAVYLGSGELLMRQPGIVGLHTLTTANALHYAYQTTTDESTRKLLLLQACSFVPMFYKSARLRGDVGTKSVRDVSESAKEVDTANNVESVKQIFELVSRDKPAAAQKLLSYLRAGGDAQQVMTRARELVFLKGRDSHDYKFSSAILEDYHHLSASCKNEFLALSVFYLKGSEDTNSNLVERTRRAIA